MKVVKKSGDLVVFDRRKLEQSLLNSGASRSIVQDVLQKIDKEIYEGISTKKIYKMAFRLLRKDSHSHAARYNLKEAIQLLGPAGFYFEKYIARLFSKENYETKTNLTLQGKCVSHEIDVLIKKNDSIAMVECKFHMGKEASTDVKVPMYILSRYNDLKERRHSVFTDKDSISGCWIVTNNRFTSDAIAFGVCSGLNLLSWDFPKDSNLRTMNEGHNLYPITCLTTLTLAEKDKLLVLDVILVKELLSNKNRLEEIGLSSQRIISIVKEASELCRYS
ncbi:ATP cone domain-containing protein [Flavobacterium sp. LS1R49]|uniref:ATP cone domain-containing protein n=1 Tax=Flavobacterium shii TaxID=2987687 RepID=A0A9X2ZAI8_9FLAO|nr:ATP cone domain-containing protein [Flavobacterium shii]MCV9926675.1 ATP cone domain-containing protein [Flavobacterium shii]